MALETLTVLIEGDVRGIENALKKAISMVTGTVDLLNKQEVDWGKIMSQAVSPAVISSVAAMFALAMEQSMSFSDTMQKTGVTAGESTAQIGVTGDAALGMATKTGAAASDIASAMANVSSIFGVNSKATQDVTEQMTMLSEAGFGPLNDIVSSSMQLFKQWGVTTEDQAVGILTDLMHGAQTAHEPLTVIAKDFSTFTDQLPPAQRKIADFNALISEYASLSKNIGQSGANAIFSALASSVGDAAGPLERMNISQGDIVKSLSSGGADVIERVAKSLAQYGPNADLIGTKLLGSGAAAIAFQEVAKKALDISTDAEATRTSVYTIEKAFDDTDTSVRELEKDWRIVQQLFTSSGLDKWLMGLAKGFGDLLKSSGPALAVIKDDIGLVTDAFGSWNEYVKKSGILDTAMSALQTTTDTLGDSMYKTWLLATQGMDAALGKNKNLTPEDALALQKVNKMIEDANPNWNAKTITSIDQRAQDTGTITQLLTALGHGQTSATQSSQTANLYAHFNLTVPSGSNAQTSQMVAKQLYTNFQGS